MFQVEIKQLKENMRRMAAIDIVLSEEENLRSFFYKCNWEDQVDMAWYENGGGDDIYIAFKGDEAIMKGFDHESEVSPHAQEEFKIGEGIYDQTPNHLLDLIRNEAIEFEDVTFCYWKTAKDSTWQHGNIQRADDVDDGSSWLLDSLHTSVESHSEWILDYHEISPDKAALTTLFSNDNWPIKDVMALEPKFNKSNCESELNGLGIKLIS